jgi:hypothetical protein
MEKSSKLEELEAMVPLCRYCGLGDVLAFTFAAEDLHAMLVRGDNGSHVSPANRAIICSTIQ